MGGAAMSELRRLELRIPVKPRSKERPRFAAGKAPFNTAAYREWKDAVRNLVERMYNPEILTGRLRISLEWHAPTEYVGDVDGLLGGIMDALQPDKQGPKKDVPLSAWQGQVAYENDGQIREIGSMRWVPNGPDKALVIILEEVETPQPWKAARKAKKAVRP